MSTASLLNIVLHDDNGKNLTVENRESFARAHEGLEPPVEPGAPPDKDRARRLLPKPSTPL